MKNTNVIPIQKIPTLLDNDYQFVDLRDPYEYKKLHLSSFINIPIENFNDHVSSLSKQVPIILLCYTGKQSLDLAIKLNRLGYRAYSIEGGFYTFQYHLKKRSSF